MPRLTVPLGVALVLSIVGSHAGASTSSDVDTPLDVRVQQLVSKVKNSLRFLKGGTFDMGDWGKQANGVYYDIDTYSRPLHRVTLDGFSMMAYKVTYEDFDVFTDATGKERIASTSWYVKYRAPKRPAGVSWYGAKDFCQWIGNVTKLPFDLPTEAQWEYAARSGGKRMLYSTSNGRIERGNNFPAEWVDGPEPPLPDVGIFPPNPAGLYGMSENTGEWVNDWFDPDYYARSPTKNPTGPATGTERVLRGSVGGTAEIAAAVFMRTKSPPQPLQPTWPQGIPGPEVMVPLPGYTGADTENFRCVLNLPKKLR